MAVNGPFQPQGSTVLVGTAAVQVLGTGSNQCSMYRIRCLLSSVTYFTFGSASNITAQAAPANGVPSANTIGMLPGSVETFTLPNSSWFISASAGAFEVTPGEGL